MTLVRGAALAVLGSLGGLVSAGAAQEAGAELPELLPRDEEFALALSAAPEHLRDGATVYVLEESGFVAARDGTNGYSCIVNRDHPRNRKPTCYDSEGSATILPKVIYFGELLMKAVPVAAIRDSVQRGFATGRFISPRRAGVAYMLSDGIRNYNPSTGEMGTFPPHIMFYAPDVTNDDIETNWQAMQTKPWLPFVAYQGPHGFFVVVVGDDSGP